jgi:heme ABC exporter ATP-binding subunit CcmA
MIHAHELGKRYGRKRVLASVNVALEAGDLLLVTGPNGSGKTTLLRLLAGLAAPTTGALQHGVERDEVGFVAHDPLVYRELSALENLDLFGRLYRVPERRERIGMLLERYGLWEARRDKVSRYSRGMQQRLALCRALLHDPRLLILDEPFTSLDADGAALLESELADARARGCGLVVATHAPERIASLATSTLALA